MPLNDPIAQPETADAGPVISPAPARPGRWHGLRLRRERGVESEPPVHDRADRRRAAAADRDARLPAGHVLQRQLQLHDGRLHQDAGHGSQRRVPALPVPAAAVPQPERGHRAAGADGAGDGRRDLRRAAPSGAAVVGRDHPRAAGAVRRVRAPARAHGRRRRALLHHRHAGACAAVLVGPAAAVGRGACRPGDRVRGHRPDGGGAAAGAGGDRHAAAEDGLAARCRYLCGRGPADPGLRDLVPLVYRQIRARRVERDLPLQPGAVLRRLQPDGPVGQAARALRPARPGGPPVVPGVPVVERHAAGGADRNTTT